MLRNLCITVALLSVFAHAAAAKEWAQKMFETAHHDFGHVARGAKADFAFEVQNLYEEDVHIADVRTSCGCATPTITKPTLKTWEKGSIVATLNTRSFIGQRSSTLTVIIDRPFYAEVPLTIAGFIHSDVDFQPGNVTLGEVEQGTPAQQEVVVTCRSRGNWTISDVRSANPHLEVELGQPVRGASHVVYKMLVRLKESAPAGSLQDQLTVATNDERLPTITLLVEGRVMPPLAASPSPLVFGTLLPGQTATKQVVIRGKQPFKLLSIVSDYDGLRFKASPEVARKLHLIPVTITAPQEPGDFQHTIKIRTDLPGNETGGLPARYTVKGSAPSEPTSARPNAGTLPR